MEFEKFKELHHKYSNSDWSNIDSNDFSSYAEAIQQNKEFHEWAVKTDLDKAGFNYSEYCCLMMANQVYLSYNENGDLENANSDVIINKWKDGTFGIPIHDGGPSIVKINFCPWCGENLETDE